MDILRAALDWKKSEFTAAAEQELAKQHRRRLVPSKLVDPKHKVVRGAMVGTPSRDDETVSFNPPRKVVRDITRGIGQPSRKEIRDREDDSPMLE